MPIEQKLRLLLKKETAGDEASQQGRHSDAVKSYSEALTLDPSHTIHNIKIQIKHCNSLIQSKQTPAAIDSCSKAIEMDNGNIDAVRPSYDPLMLHGHLLTYEMP
jgi:DnaJ family protein C protein 3